MPDTLNSENIRPAGAADLDTIFELNRASFPEAWSKQALGSALAAGFVVYVWPADDGQIAVYFLGQIVLDELHILQLVVAEPFRGRGIGSELMRFILNLMRKQGVNRAELEVRSSNRAAISLYRKLGFEITGRRPNYYSSTAAGSGREDAVLMSYHLKVK